LNAGALLLAELDGPASEVEILVEQVRQICRQTGASRNCDITALWS